MHKEDDRIALIIGSEKRRGGTIESEASWSVPGIVSNVLATVITVLGLTVPKLAASMGESPRSTTMLLFWAGVLFGLGTGFGLAMGGLMRARASKLSPAFGLLLNLVLFGTIVWGIAVAPARSGRQPMSPIPSVVAPR